MSEIQVRYEHYRFSLNPLLVDNWNGRHGVAYRYRRGASRWTPATHGGYTVCYLVEDNKIIAVGVAECSPKDNFCYAIGRKIALGRTMKQLKTMSLQHPFEFPTSNRLAPRLAKKLTQNFLDTYTKKWYTEHS